MNAWMYAARTQCMRLHGWRGALRRFEPQLVQSFMFHANVAARLAAPWAGCPWVVGGLRVAEHQKRWHLVIDRLTARWAVGSVCVSQGVMRFSCKVAGLDPARLTVIPNGIDPAPFDVTPPVPRAVIGIPDDAQLRSVSVVSTFRKACRTSWMRPSRSSSSGPTGT